MRKKIVCILLSTSLIVPTSTVAFWGNPADTAYLAQLVANAVKQLIQLQKALKTAKSNLQLIRSINKGIDNALDLIQTMNPELDPGIYKDWRKVDAAFEQLEKIYGIVVDSPYTRAQKDLDKTAALGIARNNQIFEYSKKIDQIGENIKQFARVASPKGAQKVTAQSLGVALHVMNESLRAQATGIKLQSQAIAVENKKDKDRTRQIVKTTNSLQKMMKDYKPSFELPRFK